MILKEILSRSIYGTVGTLLDQRSIDTTTWYIEQNLSFLNNFSNIVFSLNGETEIIEKFKTVLPSLLKNSNVYILQTENLGHTFGTILSDFAIFDFAKNLDIDYVWKFSNDVVIDESIFDLEVERDIDLYYINNIGYNIFNEYKKDELVEIICDMKYFYPQTNFYIMRKNITFYPDYSTLIKLYNEYQEIKRNNPNIQPWHAINECDCEHMLRKTAIQNNLKKQHILSKEATKKILDFIFHNQIHDGSHKNILYSDIGNLCHLQYPNQSVVKI